MAPQISIRSHYLYWFQSNGQFHLHGCKKRGACDIQGWVGVVVWGVNGSWGGPCPHGCFSRLLPCETTTHEHQYLSLYKYIYLFIYTDLYIVFLFTSKIDFIFLRWYLLNILGSPVLGYLAAGILIGPYGLSIIRHVHGTKAIAEFGVVFLLFNIGLEVGVLRNLVLAFSIALQFALCSKLHVQFCM